MTASYSKDSRTYDRTGAKAAGSARQEAKTTSTHRRTHFDTDADDLANPDVVPN